MPWCVEARLRGRSARRRIGAGCPVKCFSSSQVESGRMEGGRRQGGQRAEASTPQQRGKRQQTGQTGNDLSCDEPDFRAGGEAGWGRGGGVSSRCSQGLSSSCFCPVTLPIAGVREGQAVTPEQAETAR